MPEIKPNWIKTDQLTQICPDRQHHTPAGIKAWLLERGSLTLKLRQTCPTLKVNVLSESFTSPLADEAEKLNIETNHQAWLRCVQIECENQALIYARTVIPHFNADNPWYQIQQLGNQPLGEILFSQAKMSQPNLQRSEFEFCLSDHWPHQPADRQPFFARRCLFHQNGYPLLLTEVFLAFGHLD